MTLAVDRAVKPQHKQKPLLSVTFSQLDPQLGIGLGKKGCTLIGYLLTDGLNCSTGKYLAGWHLE